MLIISTDGYIRLTFDQLGSLRFGHLISGLDETDDCAAPGGITGYTEWTSAGAPVLSLGWDWIMVAGGGGIVELKRLGAPRSNCMLQDTAGADLGFTATLARLSRFVDSLAWQCETGGQIATRYRV